MYFIQSGLLCWAGFMNIGIHEYEFEDNDGRIPRKLENKRTL